MLYGRQQKKNIAATILGKVALNSAKAAADSRCMYCLHQPKQPAGIKKAFQIRRLAYGRKMLPYVCEETHMYGSIFGKRVRSIHFHCNELKNTVDNLHGKLYIFMLAAYGIREISQFNKNHIERIHMKECNLT